MVEKGWVRSGHALREEQVQPLSHSQEGSWSCVLCVCESFSVKPAVFSDPSPGTATGWQIQVLRGTNPSWAALDALAEDLGGCSGPDAVGESINYSCVSYILGMREKASFPGLGTE